MSNKMRPISEIITEFPPRVREGSRRGFEIASALPEATRHQFVNEILQNFQQGGLALDVQPVAARIGRSEAEARELITALTIAFGLIGAEGYSVEAYMDAGRSHLFSESDTAVAREIVQHATQQSQQIKRNMDRRSLAAETLPSLNVFEISIDLRLKFEDHNISDGVPVAVVHMDTDVDNRELWFQITRSDVTRLIHKLTEAGEKMDAADRFFVGSQAKK